MVIRTLVDDKTAATLTALQSISSTPVVTTAYPSTTSTATQFTMLDDQPKMLMTQHPCSSSNDDDDGETFPMVTGIIFLVLLSVWIIIRLVRWYG